MENMENQNTTSNGGQGTQQTAKTEQVQQQEKTFTQEEVNRIVGERLARVKNGADNEHFLEREKELTLKERRLDVREKFADMGIPKELLPLVDYSSEENMENSIKLISSYFKSSRNGSAGTYRISTGTSANSNSSGGSNELPEDEIRFAMGLKGKR